MYLTYTTRMMESRRDGFDEGISIGLQQGIEQGLERGATKPSWRRQKISLQKDSPLKWLLVVQTFHWRKLKDCLCNYYFRNTRGKTS